MYLHKISSVSLYSTFYILQFLRTFPIRHIFIYFHVEDIFFLIYQYRCCDTIRKSLRIRRVKVFYPSSITRIVLGWTLKLISGAFARQSIAHSNSYNLSTDQPLQSLYLFLSRDLYTTFSESNLRLIRSTFWRSRLRRDLRFKRLEFLQLSLLCARDWYRDSLRDSSRNIYYRLEEISMLVTHWTINLYARKKRILDSL